MAVAAAGFATACTGEEKPATGSAGPAPTGTPSSAARYDGPELPGLAKDPAWSIEGDHSDWKIYAVGSATALIHRADTGPTSSGAAPAGDVIEFRDVKSGEVRKTVPTTVKEASQGTFNGKPALYVYHQEVKPSDGLSAEKRVDVREVYDDSGTKVMSITKPADEEKVALVDGLAVSSKQSDPALTISDPQGNAKHKVDCGGDQLCTLSTPYVVLGSTKLPAVVGNLAFQAQPITGSSGVHALRVVATDLATGRAAWSTSTMDKPAGVAAESKVTGPHARPIRMIKDKLLLAWYTERSDGFGERGEILALHDPATGRLLVTGPELGNGYDAMVVDDQEATAVVSDAAHDSHSLAWELSSGRTLWRQEKTERSMTPHIIAGDVLYGQVVPQPGQSARGLIAVDLKTKTVRKDKVVDTPTPIMAGTGHVAVSRPTGIFVFATTP